MNIILSPHLDDAVLSLGGLLAKGGSGTVVATLFAGTPPTPLVSRWDMKCGFNTSDAAMRARIEENRLALTAFGVTPERMRNYSYLDVEYRHTGDGFDIPEPTLIDTLEKDIAALLREFASDAIALYLPGLEVHTDHRLVKTAALRAVRALAPQHAVSSFCYQDIPYAFRILEMESPRTLRNFFRRSNPHSWNFSLLERHITHGSYTVSSHPIPLTQADMEKKLSGVALYTSQIDHLGARLFTQIGRFSAAQSRFFSLTAPYCEMTYAL